MRGITDMVTPDGIRVWQIHYTADPDKNPRTPAGKEWLKKELRGYPGGKNSAKWRKEMEIEFDAVGGRLVYPDLGLHQDRIFIKPFEIPDTWKLYGGFDYATRGVSTFQILAKGKGDDFYSIWEYYKSGSGHIQTALAIKECPYFNRLEFMVADPSIWAATQQKRNTNEMVSVAQLFADQGVNFHKGQRGGDVAVAEKINEIYWSHLDNPETQPQYRIFQTCPKLYWEMGRLRYNDWTTGTAENRNVKETIVDKDNHACDAVKYIFNLLNANWMAEKNTGFDKEEHVI